MDIKQAITVIKDYAEVNTYGDFLWALGELRQGREDGTLTEEELMAFNVFVTEGVKFFAGSDV